jgi:hypothetical protein
VIILQKRELKLKNGGNYSAHQNMSVAIGSNENEESEK